MGTNSRKASVPGFGLRVLIGLVIVLNEIVFVDVLGSAGVEFVLSSAIVPVCIRHNFIVFHNQNVHGEISTEF